MHEEAKTVITPKHTLLRHVVYCCGRFAGNIKYIPDKYDYMNLEWANLYTVLLMHEKEIYECHLYSTYYKFVIVESKLKCK